MRLFFDLAAGFGIFWQGLNCNCPLWLAVVCGLAGVVAVEWYRKLLWW